MSEDSAFEPDVAHPDIDTNPEEVNHPDRYGGDTTYEAIKVLKAWLTPEEYRGFLKGTAITYLVRERKKGGKLDMEKAEWYINRYVGEYDELDKEPK